MAPHKLLRSTTAILALLALLAPALAQGAPVAPRTSRESALLKALLHSRELWATIDVCNPADQPDTVGIRGSMPGDKHPRDRMYMSFRLQYQDTTTMKWLDLASGASPAFVPVGPGGSVRQGGRSFQLVPKAGKPGLHPAGRGRLPVAARQDRAAVRSATDQRRTREPRRRRPGRLQQRELPHRLNSRGSLVMMPSTPIAVSLAIMRASSTVHT